MEPTATGLTLAMPAMTSPGKWGLLYSAGLALVFALGSGVGYALGVASVEARVEEEKLQRELNRAVEEEAASTVLPTQGSAQPPEEGQGDLLRKAPQAPKPQEIRNCEADGGRWDAATQLCR